MLQLQLLQPLIIYVVNSPQTFYLVWKKITTLIKRQQKILKRQPVIYILVSKGHKIVSFIYILFYFITASFTSRCV